MDAQTVSAAQGTSTAVVTEENLTVSRQLRDQLSTMFGGVSLDLIEEQCRTLIQTTASALIALGLRLIFLKEVTPYGEWQLTLSRIGIENSIARRMMRAAIRFSALPDGERLLQAAQNKTKLLELLVLDDDELARLNQGEAVRGVSLTTLPQTTVAVLRATLRDNAPGKNRVDAAFLEEQKRRLAAKDSLIWQSKCAVDAAFAAPSSPLPPTGEAVTTNASTSTHLGNTPISAYLGNVSSTRHLVDPESADEASNGATSHHFRAAAANSSTSTNLANDATSQHFEDETDYPAVYILQPGDYTGWPISLVRHEGKTWLIADEVAAILSQDGDELAEIQDILADWHAIGKPALLKIRLGGTPTPLLVIDPFAVEILAEGLETPESAAFAAWCAGLNSAPALAEVKALHEEPDGETPAKRMARIYAWQQRVDRQLMDVVSQIRGIHELAELSAGGDSKFSVGDLGGMLKVARRLVEETEELFTGGELDMLHLRNDLAKQEEVLH
jgi:hypothetical protein